ncbi:Retrovirus-related Pol polyprotein from transposon 17.6 [Portunus trituberculatus]|uniref:Retrovirus-related Pol polyprotein from transposon 17.6 n=1 Tax=Portunus trituberculatus TaxID=210409 RepID=A0A5B7GR02_PORTR|nr:Retrovirus-related Pol polyprotein from transposon 17.6 [Portunus trituberculatus]
MDEPEESILLATGCHNMIQQAVAFVLKVKNGQVYFPISNSTKRKVRLYPGILLASYEVLEEQELESATEQGDVRKVCKAMGPNNDHKLMDKKDWSHLSEDEQSRDLIQKHNDLFIVKKDELGLINQEPAHIYVHNPTPCRSPIYRYSEKAKIAIAEILKDLEQRDIIESSTVAWVLPIVLVNKPSGEKRLCLNYRQVNQHLVTDIHPLPKLEELVEQVAKNKFYATLDLTRTVRDVRDTSATLSKPGVRDV